MDRTDRTDNTEVLVIRKERIKRFPGLHMALIVWYRDEVWVLTQSYRKSNTAQVDCLVKILTDLVHLRASADDRKNAEINPSNQQ